MDGLRYRRVPVDLGRGTGVAPSVRLDDEPRIVRSVAGVVCRAARDHVTREDVKHFARDRHLLLQCDGEDTRLRRERHEKAVWGGGPSGDGVTWPTRDGASQQSTAYPSVSV